MKILLTLCTVLCAGMAYSYGWIQKSDFGGVARHRTVMLTIGNKFYAGLGHYNGSGTNVLFSDWWEYDPATNAWSQKADYGGGICYHAAGFTIGAYGYVGTGRISSGGNTLVTSFYRYDPATNSWIQKASLPGPARRGAVAFALNGYGYLGTGETTTGNTATFYRYDPTNDSWITIANFAGGARNSAVGFAIGGYGYVGTGNAGGSTKDFWQYNPALNTWVQKANVGTVNRQEACGFSIGNKGYIGTGDDYSSGNNFQDFWEYDVTSDTWVQLDDFDGTARRYLCAATFDGNIAYAGLGTGGTNFKDFWMFDQTLSLIERQLDDVNIIAGPNPAFDHIDFRINGLCEELLKNVDFRIYSLTGQELYADKFIEGKITVSTDSYPKGLYIYSLVYKDKFLKSEKFIVR